MSGNGKNGKRLISITRGNLRNSHIYLTGNHDFFPDACHGPSSSKNGTGQVLTLEVARLDRPVRTDIPTQKDGATPRNFFRKQGWVRPFFKLNGIQEGDVVAIEKIREFHYRIYPYQTRHSRGGKEAPNARPSLLIAASDRTSKAGRAKGPTANGNRNKLLPEDEPAHEWYRFVLSYPPQLVVDYVGQFGLGKRDCVLDPFCGTGTTLVECKKLGVPSVGLEAHPMAAFASGVKTDWDVDPQELASFVRVANRTVRAQLRRHEGAQMALAPDAHKLLLKNSISPIPLHKTLVLLAYLNKHPHRRYAGHLRLALAKGLVGGIGNLHFGPEVGVRDIRNDAPVCDIWTENALKMASDLGTLRGMANVPSKVYLHDSRGVSRRLRQKSVSAVITSPPYPNEKDYTRTTRLETVLLGFARNRKELRALKEELLRSNTRNVYKADDDDRWMAEFPEIRKLAEAIEARRLELGKTSGFERLYHRVTTLYFGGMYRHLAELRPALRRGAKLAYVVGDQASYLRIMIRTGKLLAQIAKSLGYEVERIDLFRTRLATATREQLREEVVVLRWPR